MTNIGIDKQVNALPPWNSSRPIERLTVEPWNPRGEGGFVTGSTIDLLANSDPTGRNPKTYRVISTDPAAGLLYVEEVPKI